MESSAVSPDILASSSGKATARSVAIPWYLAAVLFASTSVIVGVIWDISWHQTIGRDSFLTPAHLAIYLGGIAAGVACGWLALKTTFAGTEEEKSRSVKFWGFRAPLGAWVAIWGAFAMVTSAPFDDWWHNAYGLDVEILSPPHVVLALGIMAIQVGALLMALSWQNRSGGEGERSRGLSFAYLYGAGMLIATFAVLLTEYTYANDMHASPFYRVTSAAFPLVLFAVGRAGGMKWSATVAALAYSGLLLAMMWILPLFPAEPLLAPIRRTVTHMVPPSFPLLLVLPAIAIDLILARAGTAGRWKDWGTAAVGGTAFFLVFLAASWFFSEFLLSPAARNYVFQADNNWPYTSLVGEWQHEFWNEDVTADGRITFGAFAANAWWAIPIGIVSARAGLMWGNWMARVRR